MFYDDHSKTIEGPTILPDLTPPTIHPTYDDT
jgi:hypothetical protein